MAGGLGPLVDPLVDGLVEVNGLEPWEKTSSQVRAGRGRKRKLRSGGENHQGEAGLTSREVAR